MRKKELLCFLTELRQQEAVRINAAIAHERQMETLHKQRHDIGEILGRRVEESTIDAARRVVQSIETCNKLREAAEQREFVSDGRLDRLCEILSATTETVEEAARRAKWKELLAKAEIEHLTTYFRKADDLLQSNTFACAHQLGNSGPQRAGVGQRFKRHREPPPFRGGGPRKKTQRDR